MSAVSSVMVRNYHVLPRKGDLTTACTQVKTQSTSIGERKIEPKYLQSKRFYLAFCLPLGSGEIIWIRLLLMKFGLRFTSLRGSDILHHATNRSNFREYFKITRSYRTRQNHCSRFPFDFWEERGSSTKVAARQKPYIC
jgi:hypothetical protein